jgi:regulatory protein
MKIDRVEPSRHCPGRVLVYLEDGALLRCTEQEVLTFSLWAGAELDETTLAALKKAAGVSGAKGQAAALIGRRAMSRADLEKKLRQKGAGAADARYAAEWLESIGALNDAEYAALLVRHGAQMGYGPARWREDLRRHGVPRELWEEAVAAAPDSAALAVQYLQDRFKGAAPDEQERRRAADALARRGFAWGDVKAALSAYTDALPEETAP